VKAILPLIFATGVTAFEGVDGEPAPALFTARTVKVYAVPFDRPGMVADVCGAGTVVDAPPGDAVTV
jgi:hypothetical protein